MTTTNPDPTDALAGGIPASAPVVLSTGTRGTRILGIATIVSMAWLVAFGLGFSPADRDQREAVRILYMHVPTIWVAYMAFVVTAVSSAMVLYRGAAVARSHSAGTASRAPAPRSAPRSSPSPSSSVRCGAASRGACSGSGTPGSPPPPCCSSPTSATSPCGASVGRTSSAPRAAP